MCLPSLETVALSNNNLFIVGFWGTGGGVVPFEQIFYCLWFLHIKVQPHSPQDPTVELVHTQRNLEYSIDGPNISHTQTEAI